MASGEKRCLRMDSTAFPVGSPLPRRPIYMIPPLTLLASDVSWYTSTLEPIAMR